MPLFAKTHHRYGLALVNKTPHGLKETRDDTLAPIEGAYAMIPNVHTSPIRQMRACQTSEMTSKVLSLWGDTINSLPKHRDVHARMQSRTPRAMINHLGPLWTSGKYSPMNEVEANSSRVAAYRSSNQSRILCLIREKN